MQIVNNVQINGWSCSPKHDPAHFTVIKHFLVWMVWNISKTLKVMVGLCSASSFYGVEEPYRLNIMQPFKNFQVFSWAAPQHPMSRPSSFCDVEVFSRFDVMQIVNNVQINGWSGSLKHGPANFTVSKSFSRLDGMKLFKNIRICGWVVLSQTRASFFHGVEKPFCLDVMQPFETIQNYGWAALPNIPCHGPAHFAALKNFFVLLLCRLSTTFKSTAGRTPPITIQLISRCSTIFSSRWYEAFQKKHSFLWLGRAPPNTAQFYSRCWRTFSFECYATA